MYSNTFATYYNPYPYRTCPSCGHCPSCRRGGYSTMPVYYEWPYQQYRQNLGSSQPGTTSTSESQQEYFDK